MGLGPLGSASQVWMDEQQAAQYRAMRRRMEMEINDNAATPTGRPMKDVTLNCDPVVKRERSMISLAIERIKKG